MHLNVNGRTLELPGGSALSAVVAATTPDPRGTAVALNGSVVRSAEWAATVLQPGDVVDVVTAHQGG